MQAKRNKIFRDEDGHYKSIPIYESNDLLKAIEVKFDDMEAEITRLLEENAKLKCGVWEKEKMAELKKENERMKEEYYRGFPISKEESEAINNFIKEHTNPDYKISSIGVSPTYIFTPTSIGTIGEIKMFDGSTYTFRELD